MSLFYVYAGVNHFIDSDYNFFMGLLLYYPTPVYEKEDAMPEDFNQRLEKKIIDYSKSNEEAKNWSKQFYGDGFTSYGSDQRLHEKEEIFSELENSKKIFKKYNWPIIDVTRKSVEETAAAIIKILDILNYR